MRDEPAVFRKYDIRGEVPEEIDADLVYELGKALGHYWDAGNVVLGRDIRESSPDFYQAMASGLLRAGCEVTLVGLATTDMTAYLAKKEFDAGVQITASHMPPNYGGFKPLNSEGRILSNEEMAQIKQIYRKNEAEETGGGGELAIQTNCIAEYRKALEDRYRELFDQDLKDLKVVVDCSNSVGALAAPEALESLGAEVVKINDEFDPMFSAHSPEPSEKSAEQLANRVVEEEAGIGVIFDGDADRVMFVDENGEFLDGDIPLALLSKKYLDFSDNVVCSINTGKTVADTVEGAGGKISYAPVGAVFTALKCINEDVVFGGQPNGHLMDAEFVPYDSGSLFALMIPGMMVEAQKSLSELREELPRYRTEKFNHRTADKEGLMARLVEKAESEDRIVQHRFNALKLEFDDFQVLFRPSGSEELIRVTLEGRQLTEEDVEIVRSYIEDLE